MVALDSGYHEFAVALTVLFVNGLPDAHPLLFVPQLLFALANRSASLCAFPDADLAKGAP